MNISSGMKKFFFFFFLVGVLFAQSVFAQEAKQAAEASVQEVLEAETVTIADLGVGDPSLLPTSPFYFVKEIKRGLQRVFTFSSVAKTELELKIASEKAAEAAKVAEKNPQDEHGISRALLNYERAQERLRQRLANLGDTSENPNVDRLLDQVAQRQIVHEKLLEGLEAKHEEQRSTIKNIQDRVQGVVEEIAKKDTATKFQERLRSALEDTKGSTLKHIRSVEILDRLQESDQLSDEAKEKLEQLRGQLSEQASQSVEEFARQGEDGVNRLRDALQRIPGDILERTTVLEEIRAGASDRVANALGQARDSLDENIEDGEDLTKRVEAQIEESEQRLQRIETKLHESGRDIPQVITTLIDQAKDHLEKAKEALRQGNPREAFGLARAAEAIIANILRWVEYGIDAIQNAPGELDRILDRVNLNPIRVPERADDSSTKPGNDSETNLEDEVFCIQIYDPVCGVNGRTFSNRCMAEQAGIRVVYEGVCRPEDADQSGTGGARKYESRDISFCANAAFVCPGGSRAFNDSTGCGCEPFDSGPVTDVFPCPLFDVDSLKRECDAKGGEIIETESSTGCGLIPVCQEPTSLAPATKEVTLAADDYGFYPSGEIRVAKGTKVRLTFNVTQGNVYFAGLDFRSPKFVTNRIDPGKSTTVEFTADESFEFKSYWPASSVLKATGKVIVE